MKYAVNGAARKLLHELYLEQHLDEQMSKGSYFSLQNALALKHLHNEMSPVGTEDGSIMQWRDSTGPLWLKKWTLAINVHALN